MLLRTISWLFVATLPGIAFAADDKKPSHTVDDVRVPDDYFQVVVTHPAMYSEFEFTIVAKKGDMTEGAVNGAAQEAFDAIDQFESRISTWRRGTQASRINSEGAKNPVGVAGDVLYLVQTSVHYWKETDGAFDITVGPLVELWKTSKAVPRLPTEAELTETRSRVGSDKLIVIPEDHSVGFAKEGMRLDFGGIAKGAALDKAKQVLEGYGITCALLDAGTSSMVAIGTPPGAAGWTVRLKHPYNDSWFDEVTVCDEAISTSGYLLDHVEINGKKYGHIIDPKNGMPVQGTIYAMVIGRSGTQTEALSKGFFINGIDWARQYCQTNSEVRAILVPEPAQGEDPKPVRINFTK